MGQIITMGDVQDPITKEFQGDLERYINEIGHEGYDEAWFFVHMKPYPHGTFVNNVRVAQKLFLIKIVACPTEPPKVLASACFHVNYRTGKLARLWMLAPDNPKLIQVAGETGYLSDEPIRKNEGPMRETELIEDAQSIKPALIHRHTGRMQ